MNKAYSTKALPPGTVLREWRLEEVLGVGGFGIVYKGRGIYFNELVAIKEYFPSSISDRDAEATVVPIDSNAEEVHALGLKKFVEEAKLLWNLSTPTRHPNIVSVRSLFEIHGTAYMVMDFEDGSSLSQLLRQGQRWNERSLLALVKPIAEGLDRAHRVGVLHRDIKPPNILINDVGRPVLIDFGSARFEAAEATSTKVTFHTPPYAAIEQYVKSYDQGPWTDIYALGVVLFECITGAKPPEVLERMHASSGKALAEGDWPGYSKRFLAAVDAAMAVKPSDRPQSISEWLALLDGSTPVPGVPEPEEDITRIAPFDTASPAIVPIAPPAAGFVPANPADTGVPESPSKAEFKRVGVEPKPKQGKAAEKVNAEAPSAGERPTKSSSKEPATASTTPAAGEAVVTSPDRKSAPSSTSNAPRNRKALLVGIAAAAVAVVIGGGWALSNRGSEPVAEAPIADLDVPPPAASIPADQLTEGLRSLVEGARAAGVSPEVLEPLSRSAEDLDGMVARLGSATNGSPLGATPPASSDQMQQLARTAHAFFANSLLKEAEDRATRTARDAPWADPARAETAASQTPERRSAAANLRSALEAMRTAADSASSAPDAGLSLAAASEALRQFQSFTTAALAVSSLAGADRSQRIESAPGDSASDSGAALRERARGVGSASPAERPQPAPVASTPALSEDRLSPATASQFQSIISDGRDMAKQVIRMGEASRPGGTPEQKQAHDLLRANMRLARSYDSSLVTLRDSFRGVRSDKEAARLIQQARQTRAYLVFLVKQSSEAR